MKQLSKYYKLILPPVTELLLRYIFLGGKSYDAK